MRVMAFAAHPDDELVCAGTLAKYAAKGHKVAIVFITNGEVGSEIYGNEEIARIRKEEARASAAVIGAEFYWLGVRDEFLYTDEPVRRMILDVMRQFDPDIVICPDKDVDYHPDHIAAGQLVWDVRVMTTVPNIKTGHKPCTKIPMVAYQDTVMGLNFMPEKYVDVSDYWDAKAAMTNCHESQKGWLEAQYGVTHLEFVRVHTMFRGFQAGCKYAEAFKFPRFFPMRTESEGLL
ncbi:MAG: PIG-L deacetylase family protein [Sphaerochaetaceae bacterium]|nr:PIG-L family deacetylase [Spirochaetales bacterium]